MNKNYIEFFKKLPILKDLTETEIFVINELVTEKYFEPNFVIIQENENSDDLYFIVEGEVEVLKLAHNTDQPILICKLGESEIFGDMAFISDETRSSSIKTTKPSLTLKLSKKDVNNFIPSVFLKITNKLANINATRLRRYYEKL